MADRMVFMISLLLSESGVCWLAGAAALELGIEALGIEGVGRSRDAGQDRQGNDGRQDGLHDQSPWLESCR